MKNLPILILSFAFCAIASLAGAAEINLATADMNRLYQNYYRAIEAKSRFDSAVESADSSVRTMMEEGQALVEEYQRMVEEVQSPALSAEARERAEGAAQEKRQEIQQKEQEVQQFQANTQRMLQQQQMTHRQLMMDEIKEVVRAIATERGATLVLDSSGASPQALGGAVLYVDPSFDVTEEALAELNKNQPQQ